jgi:hypothetical protein
VRGFRDIILKAIEMRGTGWVPCEVVFLPATWQKYREQIVKIILRHRRLFPEFKPGTVNYDDLGMMRKGNTFTDEWGCVWSYNFDGLGGIVAKHPLEDWNSFKDFSPPHPELGLPGGKTILGQELGYLQGIGSIVDWDTIGQDLKKTREDGFLVVGGLPHGFMFQRLTYIRGFTNLMKDFIKKPPQLYELIGIVTEYNEALVDRILKLGVDAINFGDDLGCQDRMPISKKTFREFIFPAYNKIFKKVREAGVHPYFHTDGHVMEVADDLIESGASVLNIQDVVNGIDNIKDKCKGRVCVGLDIDRQRLMPFGTPPQVKDHIKWAIIKLGSNIGGLMLLAGIYPDAKLKNIEALCQAMEQYMGYYKEEDEGGLQ